jgi:hypothetical protein
MKKKASTKLRALVEADVDGFPTDAPEWVAYCPRCGMKLPLAEHETCPNFRGEEAGPDGDAAGVRCAYEAAPAPKPRRTGRKGKGRR